MGLVFVLNFMMTFQPEKAPTCVSYSCFIQFQLIILSGMIIPDNVPLQAPNHLWSDQIAPGHLIEVVPSLR